MSNEECVCFFPHALFAIAPVVIGGVRSLLGDEFREAFQTEDFDFVLIFSPWFIILGTIFKCFGNRHLGFGRLSYNLTILLYLIVYITIWSFQVKSFLFSRRNLNDLEISRVPPANDFERDIYFIVMGTFKTCCDDDDVLNVDLTCRNDDIVLPCVAAEDEYLFNEIQFGLGDRRAPICNSIRGDNGRSGRFTINAAGGLTSCRDGIEEYSPEILGYFRRLLIMHSTILFIYSTSMIGICLLSLFVHMPGNNEEVELKDVIASVKHENENERMESAW